MVTWDRVAKFIDTLNGNVGKIVAFGFLIPMLIQVYEVISRYVFGQGTTWSWEVNGQFFTACVLLGGGYTLLHGAHVRMTLVYEKFSLRKRTLINIFTFPVFALFLVALIWTGGKIAWHSWEIKEVSYSYFAPPLYPLRTVVVIGALLLLMQGSANFIRELVSLRRPEGKGGIK